MTKKKTTRIVELHLHRSKKNPRLCYVVAILFPCSHRKKLGICKTPKNMEGNFKRVESVRIWIPSDYSVTDREGCFSCPTTEYWIHDLPKLEELKEIESEVDFN